ncbi:MAG: CoA-binding protein, partial [Lentisphaeraceae bacterium]|nr:CoA-binding protein [Lentisphaeraceae bacterium]
MKPTLIIGASPRSSSYANLAMHQLEEVGHAVLLYNPLGRNIDERQVYTDLSQ